MAVGQQLSIMYNFFFTSVGEGVCKLTQTCCSEEAEESFKVSTVKDYRDEIMDHLSSLMDCHSQSIFSECVLNTVC